MVAVDTKKVSAIDVCQTPPHALEPLYQYIPKRWVIWESACGPERILQKAFEAQGYKVIGTDLMYGKQYNRFSYRPMSNDPFSAYEPVPLYDVEVTNCPFSVKYQWFEQAFEDGTPFAILAPYETTASGAFKNLCKHYTTPDTAVEVLAPERRLNYKMPNKGWDSSAQMPTCWITWKLNVSATRNDYLRTFYVPMRNVKYNDDNTERK